MCFHILSKLPAHCSPTSSTMALALNPNAQDYVPTSPVSAAPLETYYCYSTPIPYSPYPLRFPGPFYFAPYHNKLSCAASEIQSFPCAEICYLSHGTVYYTSSWCPRKEDVYGTGVSHMSLPLPSCLPQQKATLTPFSGKEDVMDKLTSVTGDSAKVRRGSEDNGDKDNGGVLTTSYTKCRPRKPVRRSGDDGSSSRGRRKMYLPRAGNRRRVSRHGDHGKIAAELEFKGAHSPPSETGDEKTTVMIRNLPNNFTKKKLLEILDNHCFEENQKIRVQGIGHPSEALTREIGAQGGGGTATALSQFDFLYLPIDFRTGNNMGYAFVNFTSATAAWRLYNYLHNHSWIAHRSPKTCAVTYARLQGLEALVENFSSSNFMCNNDAFLPACFSPPRDGSCRVSEQLIGRRLSPRY